MRFALAIGLATLAIACTNPAPPGLPIAEPPPAPVPSPSPSAPLVITGRGIGNSAPFELPDGDYALKWEAIFTGTGPNCLFSGFLTSTDQGVSPHLVANEFVPAGPLTERINYVYNVRAGRYYFNMLTGCDWRITITPI